MIATIQIAKTSAGYSVFAEKLLDGRGPENGAVRILVKSDFMKCFGVPFAPSRNRPKKLFAEFDLSVDDAGLTFGCGDMNR